MPILSGAKIVRLFVSFVLAIALSACSAAAAGPRWDDAALNDLVAVAEASPLEGLPAEDTALAEIARFRDLAQTDPNAELQADMAADALFVSLARSFSQGVAEPARADPDWAVPLAGAPDFAALSASREAGVAPSWLLRPLLPQNAEYAALREELARLRAEGADAAHLAQVRASLERWRWLPRELPLRRLEVRIPQFELRSIADDAPVSAHKAIVGARTTQTPSFVAEVRSITINPYWDPPSSIAAELLRRFRRDPGAAAREGFVALTADGAPAASVDWSARPFPYRIRQLPGPANALGRIRFDMANDYAIRLHDTPNRALFGRDMRALSHGCIRVEGPEALAAELLNAPDWTADTVTAAIDTGEQQVIELAAPMPVYLLYITVTTNQDGQIAYADDIYHRDAAVVAALDAPDAALARQPDADPLTCAAEPAMP